MKETRQLWIYRAALEETCRRAANSRREPAVARQADIGEDFIHAFLQIEVWRRCWMIQPLF
jgi:hypothetical protein